MGSSGGKVARPPSSVTAAPATNDHDQVSDETGTTSFTSVGPIPPVALDAVPQPLSASDRAYGRSEGPYTNALANTPANKHANDVGRLDSIYDTAEKSAEGITNSLVPAYLAARDNRDTAAVAELGGQIIGAYGRLHGAELAIADLSPKVPRQSFAGSTAEQDANLAATQQSFDKKSAVLAVLTPLVDSAVASALMPHKFHGHEVAGQAVIVELDRVPPARRSDRLAGELQRTISMLVLADELRASLLEKKGLDRAHVDTARARLVPWASRPLDLAFLRAVLGPAWDVLDATANGPMQTKPSEMLTAASKQATHTGWLGDTGGFDINEATNELRMGGRESAEFVLRQLYTSDPDTRARLLMQIKQRGLLDALCSAVGWQDIKDLHDSLGGGFAEIKTDLQHYFLGKGKYGPSLGTEWENHDRSLHGLVGRLGGVGKVLNFALDIGTFGFNSSYGKAIDDRSEGLTSEAESSRAQVNAFNRTAAIAAVSLLTGGMADKWVRGGAGAVSTARGIAAGAAGGSVGAVSAVATSDTYNVYVSGEQQSFSSPEEYVKAALLGGAIGGAIGGVTQGLSNRAAGYLPKGVGELPESTGAASTRVGEDPAVARQSEPDSPVQNASKTEAPADKLATGAEPGLDANPQTVSQGTVRMEEHPDFPSVVRELEAKGYRLEYRSGNPKVEVREVLKPSGDLVRVEKIVWVRAGMRFLDLEHELGHIKQLEGFKTPRVTDRVLEDGREYKGPARPGFLTTQLDTITEYHNRLTEFFRLKERGVDPDVLAKHAAGVREWRKLYWGKGLGGGASKTGNAFVAAEFPDLAELEARFDREEGLK